MAARFEVTKKYAAAYAAAPKKGKSQILDQVVEVTGWNRDHARQQLVARLRQPPGRASATVAVIDRRRTKPRKYSYDALLVLQRVWAASGGSCVRGRSRRTCRAGGKGTHSHHVRGGGAVALPPFARGGCAPGARPRGLGHHRPGPTEA